MYVGFKQPVLCKTIRDHLLVSTGVVSSLAQLSSQCHHDETLGSDSLSSLLFIQLSIWNSVNYFFLLEQASVFCLQCCLHRCVILTKLLMLDQLDFVDDSFYDSVGFL